MWGRVSYVDRMGLGQLSSSGPDELLLIQRLLCAKQLICLNVVVGGKDSDTWEEHNGKLVAAAVNAVIWSQVWQHISVILAGGLGLLG